MDRPKATRRNAQAAGKPAHATDEAASPWEWVVAGLGFVLIAGMIGYMAYSALTMRSEPPRIVITRDSVEPSGDGFLMTVTIVNRGASTAAALTIEGELLQDGSTLESSEVTIDYLPSHSSRSAGLFFNRDPSRHRIELRPKGYTKP